MQSRTGDLLENVSSGLILQQVNCQGMMGSGFAKAVLEKYPVVRERFVEFSGPPYTQKNSGADLLGQIQLVEVSPTLIVVNLFTQQFFGRDGKRYTSYDALDTALESLRELMDETGTSDEDVHHPAIGSGLGGAHWAVVQQIVQHRLGTNTTLWVLT